MENNTYHIFIELFLRNDLIKFIQVLQTFQQTWCKLWNTSSTHLQQFFNTSSSHQIIFENRSSKLFKHFIECRSSSQHLFQHSFHISFQQYFITTIEWQTFHPSYITYFHNSFTTILSQYFHKTFITTYESQLMNNTFTKLSSQQLSDRTSSNTSSWYWVTDLHHNNFITTILI